MHRKELGKMPKLPNEILLSIADVADIRTLKVLPTTSRLFSGSIRRRLFQYVVVRFSPDELVRARKFLDKESLWREVEGLTLEAVARWNTIELESTPGCSLFGNDALELSMALTCFMCCCADHLHTITLRFSALPEDNMEPFIDLVERMFASTPLPRLRALTIYTKLMDVLSKLWTSNMCEQFTHSFKERVSRLEQFELIFEECDAFEGWAMLQQLQRNSRNLQELSLRSSRHYEIFFLLHLGKIADSLVSIRLYGLHLAVFEMKLGHMTSLEEVDIQCCTLLLDVSGWSKMFRACLQLPLRNLKLRCLHYHYGDKLMVDMDRLIIQTHRDDLDALSELQNYTNERGMFFQSSEVELDTIICSSEFHD